MNGRREQRVEGDNTGKSKVRTTGLENGALVATLWANRGVRIACFLILIVVYTWSLVYSYESARAFHIGDAVLKDVHRAWLTEALPWVISCGAAVGLSWVMGTFHNRRMRVVVPLGVSLFMVGWLVKQPITYSTDILRYLWDGHLMVHGVNPYRYIPSDTHLTALQRWPYFGWMSWKQWPEAYPPVAQLYFGLIAAITNGTAEAYKHVLFINACVSSVLFYLVLRKRSGGVLSHRDVRHFALFNLFPPYLIEAYGSAHVDAFAVPWILLAWLFWLQQKPGRLGFAIAMATSIKLYPIVFLAAMWSRRNWKEIVGSLSTFTATIAVTTIPFLSAGLHILDYYTQKISQMGYNDSLFYLLRSAFGSAVSSHSTALVFLCELVAWYIVLFTKARRLPMELKATLLGLTFLLASPLMHPWYLVSLLPFAIPAGEWATLWLAVTAHLTYDEFIFGRFVEYIPAYWMYVRVWFKAPPEPVAPDETR